MKVTKDGIELIKTFEGCRLRAYRDAIGVWTIGYGHTSMAGPPKVVPGMVITEEEAEEILWNDVNRFAEQIRPLIKTKLNDNQFSALVSFAYNVGVGNFKRSSVLKAVNEGRLDDVPTLLMRWVKAGGRVLRGLVRRRKAEGKLFMKSIGGSMKTIDEYEKVMGRDKGIVMARLRLREGPSTKHKVIAVMPIKAKVVLLDKDGEWYKVMWEDEIGWAYGKYIKEI